jgi:hypothetical protein
MADVFSQLQRLVLIKKMNFFTVSKREVTPGLSHLSAATANDFR